jgi:hypothetical protein
MSEAENRTRMTLKALVMVLGIGVVATAAAWLLQDLAVEFIGGAAYRDLQETIWAFAGIGTIWAMLQLLVYNVVARQNKTAVGVVWAGMLVLVALSPGVTTIGFLLTAVVAVEGVVLLVLLFLGLRRTGVPTGFTPV